MSCDQAENVLLVFDRDREPHSGLDILRWPKGAGLAHALSTHRGNGPREASFDPESVLTPAEEVQLVELVRDALE